MARVLERHNFTGKLADVFEEDSGNEQTIYGFPDKLSNTNSNLDDDVEPQPGLDPHKEKTTSKPSSGGQTFKLRMVLRSAAAAHKTCDNDDDGDDKEETRTRKTRGKRAVNTGSAKKRTHVRLEDEETAVAKPDAPEEGAGEDDADSFLVKRQQNIKANKAMLAQLMADLDEMPGGAGILKKQAGKRKREEKSSRPPRFAAAESRRNPERVSRRLTRSMGGGADLLAPYEPLYNRKVRRAPGPTQSKPPVGDITEDELQLVADNMTEKVYNRVTIPEKTEELVEGDEDLSPKEERGMERKMKKVLEKEKRRIKCEGETPEKTEVSAPSADEKLSLLLEHLEDLQGGSRDTTAQKAL